jgi:hypothetical protein
MTLNVVNICLVSDQHIGQLLNRDLLMSYVDFAQKFLAACDVTPKVANIPVRVSLSIWYSFDNVCMNLLCLKLQGRLQQ